MRTTPRRLASAAVAALALLAPLTATADDLPESRHSPNLEMVAHLPSESGTDIEFFSRDLPRYKDANLDWVEEPSRRHFAIVGNQGTGAQFIDITDPEAPFEVARLDQCRVGQGDPQVNAEGTIALIASQSGTCTLADGRAVTDGSMIIDLEDPYTPTPIAEADGVAHNNSLHPSGDYVYISSSSLAGAGVSPIPIWDISDPHNPVFVKNLEIPANGPHDIRFSDDGTRAYLAGISLFHVVNTEDPENPVIISSFAPPGGSIGHDTLITRDKRFLFVGDEGGGGGTYWCPGGALYVYDLTNEAAPILLGAVEAGGGPVTNRQLDQAGAGAVTSCTSHVMSLNPDGQSLTIGWYGLGFRIFDFSSFYNADGTPKTAAGVAAAWGPYGVGMTETHYMIPDGGSTWSAKQYAEVPGYVFADDLEIGFYVAKITG